MITALLITAERINYGSDFNVNYVGTATYPQLPTKGSYVQVRNQPLIAYVVKEIIYPQSNKMQFDVILILGNGLSEITTEKYNKIFQDLISQRNIAEQRKNTNLKKATDPDEKGKEKRELFRRFYAGQKVEEIATDTGLTVGQVKRRISDWRIILNRVDIDKEKP